ncbi:phosphatidylinositol kinase- protein kinase tor1 [Coemansia sp. RSA 1721]|nr:phosphatidylinositol kinase- protein kinase tor1 [Coemansia sp. RSA 1721]
MFLEPTTKAIRDILLQHTKLRNIKSDTDENTTAILQTIAVLAKAFGPVFTKHMHEILDLMFTTGLCQALCESLADIGNSIAQLRKPIQDRLLDMVSIILIDMPFRSVQPSLDNLETCIGSMSLHYTPNISTRESLIVGLTGSMPIVSTTDTVEINGSLNGSTTTLGTIHKSHSTTNNIAASEPETKAIGSGSESMSLVVSAAKKIPVTNETLIFALRVLGSFNFSSRNLSEFVTNSLIPYLTHSSAAVRRSAVQAITHILISDPLYDMIAGAGFEVTSEVVQRLIALAVTDIDSDVRLMTMRMLEKGHCFDFHMGKAQNIQALFLLLNDETFDVRLTVISIIGRVVNVNPSHVMPPMRRLIVQLLTQLESAHAVRERDESTQMIMMLVLSANHSVHPYVSDILRTILPRIDDGPPQLVSKLFDTIAALAQVNSNALMPYSNRILASIMQTLGGSTSWQKCMSALKALSSCASYCSMVIDPYTQYPQLFAILLRLLKTESDDIKEETMRVIGALGAVDPHRHKDMLHHGFTRGGSTVYNISGHSQTLAFSGTSKDNNTITGMDTNNVNNGFINAANAARQGSLLGKKRGGKRYGGPPPNVMTVFNSEMPRESLVGDIQVDSYGTTFTNDPSYFTSVSVNALLQILNSKEDAKSHLLAVQALNTMFAPLQNICGKYLDSVVPAILRAMKAAPPEAAESYIERLGRLVGIARQLIRPYLEPLFELFDSETIISEQRQNVLISLVEVMVEALSGNLGHNTNKIVSFLISVLDRDLSKTRRQALNAIHALQILSPSLDNYIFLIIPRLVALLDPETLPMTVVIKSLEAIGSIVSSVCCKSFASRIINVLVRLLQTTSDLDLQTSIIDMLCIMMEQLQDEFTLFMPTVNAIMKKRGLADNPKYERYSRLLFTGKLEPMQKQRVQPLLQGESSQKDSLLGAIAFEIPQLNVDANQLRNSWIIQQQQQQQGSSINMMRWLDNFTIELISQSPSPAIRACKELAQSNQSLRSKLFNAAFVSCWTVLSVEYQKEVFDSLQEVAAQIDVPADILQTILSLAGFMERDGKVTPINLKLLGQYADRCHALAKELHYKEEEWTMEGDYDTITQLIQLNQSLDLHDSAIGMLNYVCKEQPDIEESVEWYTRLERWDDALKIYRQEEAEFGYSSTNLIGQIQCLYKVCDWESLVPIYDRIWQSSDSNLQSAAAMIGTNMAWAMNDIDRMVTYLPMLPSDSRDKSLSRALLAVYQNQFDDARAYIRSARAEMRNNLISYLTESYGRGYMQVFRCQMLTELEEVISYKQAINNREQQVAITNTWRKRLDGIRQDVGMWQKLLRLRSMVLRPILDLDTWIKYVNMCRTSNRMKIARRAIHLLLEDEANFMDEVNNGQIDIVSSRLLEQAQEYVRLRDLQHQQQQQQQQQQQMLFHRLSIAESQWGGQSRRFSVSSASSSSHIGSSPLDSTFLDAAINLCQHPALVYMYLKFKWAANEHREAFQMLEMFTNNYSARIGFDPRNPEAFDYQIYSYPLTNGNKYSDEDKAEKTHMHRLLARFYFRRGEWLRNVQQSVTLAEESRAKAGISSSVVSSSSNTSIHLSSQCQNGKKEKLQSVSQFGHGKMFGENHGLSSKPKPKKSDFASSTSLSSSDVKKHKNGAAKMTFSESVFFETDSTEAQAAEDFRFLYQLKGDRIDEFILESYRAATILDEMSYKAWHQLAVWHYSETQKYGTEHADVSEDIVESHVVPAVHGFFRAIQLSMGFTTLQDMLRLLTVWFNYAQHKRVVETVQTELNSISLQMWIQVIPQILARAHIQHESTVELIKRILVEVGKLHPNAVLFPLYVAARGDNEDRVRVSKTVLASLHELSPEMVEETEVVSRELIRITLLSHEIWHDALEYTAKMYFELNNDEDIQGILMPLHKKLHSPETFDEHYFLQAFGKTLAMAEQYMKKYFSARKGYRNVAYIHQAWKYYTVVYNECLKETKRVMNMLLENTAPILLQCRDMHLAIPGTYDPDREIVQIDSFEPVVTIFDSKQHPREMHIHGSDGNKYTFILKGHEDLRQDERVMQLFGLVNSLLAVDEETSRRSLAIERYPVTPLSSNSGLIGFYPNCENITDVIRSYRRAHQRYVQEENEMLFNISSDWQTLSSIERIESYEYVMERTRGDDLQQAMWYNSPNAETWLERRTNYTRSMAVMSVVGYILGLGDRHLTNILLHSSNGKVVHIDLGDCFEIAIQREGFPETVPFRLTRMVMLPMEVSSSIEGTFRFTANHTMRVLRANRDSLMAVLEAFVFDPLVSWSFTQETETITPTQSMAGGRDTSSIVESQVFSWKAMSRPNNFGKNEWVLPGSRPENAYSRSFRVRGESINEKGWQNGNPKAKSIFKRIHSKLVGTDFDPNVPLSAVDQVEKLIQQATSPDNLAVMYAGWMPIW